jgi:hypothetical protein
VVLNHITLALFPEILFASPEARSNSIWQQPFVLLFFTGYPWVALFLILSGWVNALKPLILMNSGHQEKAAVSLSSSCFRRILRLILPITVATTISWVMAQLGAYKIGRLVDNGWLNDTRPEPSMNFYQAVMDLFHNFYSTWAESSNYYDKNLWCMAAFLSCSFALYLALLATSKTSPIIRRMIFLGLFIWSWRRRDGKLFEFNNICH